MKKIIALVLCAVMMLSLASTALAATGVGCYTTVTSNAATEDKAGKVAVTTTVCAVTLDENGIITAIMFDAIQPAAAFDTTGALNCDEKQVVPTKRERGLGYNMKNASPIGLEWYEQMDAFEQWCIGKTVEQVLACMGEDGYPADADVLTGCTIHITDQMAALKNAAENAR